MGSKIADRWPPESPTFVGALNAFLFISGLRLVPPSWQGGYLQRKKYRVQSRVAVLSFMLFGFPKKKNDVGIQEMGIITRVQSAIQTRA